MINKLDTQTLEFLRELENNHQVRFKVEYINHCRVFSKDGISTIYYNPDIIDSESITHELLHIWLQKYNYMIGNHIYFSCKSHPSLSKVFSKPLCDYIANCFDHLKMYPKYREMGYSDEKFVHNGLNEKCSIRDIKNLRLSFMGIYRASSIDKFIGFLISIYADHVQHNYIEHLELLNQKDNQLFKTVTDFWKSWEIFDITAIYPIFNSDLNLGDKFIFAMEEWVEKKKVI